MPWRTTALHALGGDLLVRRQVGSTQQGCTPRPARVSTCLLSGSQPGPQRGRGTTVVPHQCQKHPRVSGRVNPRHDFYFLSMQNGVEKNCSTECRLPTHGHWGCLTGCSPLFQVTKPIQGATIQQESFAVHFHVCPCGSQRSFHS